MESHLDINLVLKQRANKLAEIRKEESTEEVFLTVLEFILGDERYAVETCYIKEVYPFKEVSILPDVPSFVYGLINVRRKILSVIDIRKLFNLKMMKDRKEGKVLILEKEEMDFGILVEEVVGLRKIALTDLQSHLPTLTGVCQEFLKGITNDRLVLLDGGQMLNSSSIIVCS